jgi:hypothetical protein
MLRFGHTVSDSRGAMQRALGLLAAMRRCTALA